MRILILMFFGPLFAMSKPSIGFHPIENVGVRTSRYEDVKRGRPVVVEIWYPTDEKGRVDVPEDPIWIHPKEARDAPMLRGEFPMIIMSHGHGGDRRDRTWLVEPLVKNGFIIASVEHYGNSSRNYNPEITLRFWERAKDISFAISQLIKDPILKGQIDSKRIGFIGYSMGGMTGLILGGAKMQNAKKIAVQFLSKYKEVDKINLEMVEATDFAEADGSFADSRIKAMALLSPAAFAIPAESFKKITVPVALVASEGDEVLQHEEHALKILENLKQAKLKLFRDKISHYVFLNRVSDIGKNLLRPDIQSEVIQKDRLKIHDEVNNFLVAFFKEHLR